MGQVKELVLSRLRFAQNPDRFHPRRVTGGSGVPDCERPEEPVALDAGATIEGRWELPFDDASGLKEVGSEHTVVHSEVVESEAPDALQSLDIIATGEADEVRHGRNLRIEQPSTTVIEREATAGDTGPSLGQLFDRMIADDALAGFIAAQPADSSGQGDLVPWRGRPAFTAVTTAYEKAIGRLIEVDGDAWEESQAVVSESLAAHEWLIPETPIDDELNVVTFETGLGDGGYPVFVGLGRDGKPTRFVIDCGLVLLDSPQS